MIVHTTWTNRVNLPIQYLETQSKAMKRPIHKKWSQVANRTCTK